MPTLSRDIFVPLLAEFVGTVSQVFLFVATAKKNGGWCDHQVCAGESEPFGWLLLKTVWRAHGTGTSRQSSVGGCECILSIIRSAFVAMSNKRTRKLMDF